MLSSLISMLRLAEWPRVCSALITALQRTLGMIGNDFVKINFMMHRQSTSNTLGSDINHHVEYINRPIKYQKCGRGNLCSAMFYTLGKSENHENFWCLRPSVVLPLQETYTFLRWKKQTSPKKHFPIARYFFTSFKMFFCWAWCDFESFLKGKLQASDVWTSKLVGCIGYRDQICSIVWFFRFKTPTRLSYPKGLWIRGMVWGMIDTYMICICIFIDHDN